MIRSMAALVIGNAAYPAGSDLANPVHDADDLAAKLEGYGFEVVKATDCGVADLEKALVEFRALLETHDVGLFFFAGHGMQIDGVNYLLAIDTNTASEIDAKHSSLSLDKVIDVMANSSASTKIIILDACRNNPWERRWHRDASVRGLASVYAPKGTIIGFATSPGQFAADGEGRNGTYTEALLHHIDTPDCTIETMFKRVRNTVAAATGGRQTSWEHTSLSGEFYFNLSLGNLIDDYGGTALADSLFVLDEGNKTHQAIIGLKTYNWYKQNDALALVDLDEANRALADSLFVLGRNIYQAACGSADAALKFIEGFMNRTRGFDPEKRKAILDGILFEIFFDAKGAPRVRIKKGLFNEVFSLQRHEELKPSFDFIAETLMASRVDFYAVPGKGHELAITVAGKNTNFGPLIEGVYVDGVNVLRADEGAWHVDDSEVSYSKLTPEMLARKLQVEFVVPAHLLSIAYLPAEIGLAGELNIRTGWTVRK